MAGFDWMLHGTLKNEGKSNKMIYFIEIKSKLIKFIPQTNLTKSDNSATFGTFFPLTKNNFFLRAMAHGFKHWGSPRGNIQGYCRKLLHSLSLA